MKPQNKKLNRRSFLKLAVTIGSASAMIPTPGKCTDTKNKPNILIILTDDQGFWDVGVHGNAYIDTPVMDKLAKEGVNLKRFYAAPVCAPTRAGLLTGRYALRTGVYNTRFGGDTLDAGEITIAELLKNRGYRTGIFGKWHLGMYSPSSPNAQGFEQALTFSHGHIERYDYPSQLTLNGEPVETRGYITDLVTDATIKFIKKNKDAPFFCYLPYNVPHEPFEVGDAVKLQGRGDKLITKYLERGLELRDARIYAMIERCDQNIGRILDTIADCQLKEQTCIFFMSDNGGINDVYKAGLRGFKSHVWEGGVRVPFFAYWPDHFATGVQSNSMASHVDLLPTICEMTQTPIPSDRTIDGKSILAVLNNPGQPSPHKYVYHTWNRYVPRDDNNWAIGGQRFKLANGELYDLENDPGEQNNIASQHPEKVKELRQEFVRWFKDVTKGKEYEPIAIPVGLRNENPVEIQASWAKLVGDNIIYTFRGYDWDTIDFSRQTDDRAEWDLDIHRPGRYKVTMAYGSDYKCTGSVLQLAVQNETLELLIDSTLTPEVFVKKEVGFITLQKGEALLWVKRIHSPTDGMITLNRIWLEKVD